MCVGSLGSWGSLFWTSTLGSYTESSTTAQTRQTAHLDRSEHLTSILVHRHYVCIKRCHCSRTGSCVCVYINVLFHQEDGEVASNPPESSFQKLAPSETRYTLLRDRDELWPQRLYHKPDLWPTTPWHAPESVSRVRTGQRDGTATPQLTPNTLNGEREEEERIRKTRE